MSAAAAAPIVGALPSGPRDSIADVDGVTVGHFTLDDGPVQTGVTVVRPHRDNVFAEKLAAAVVVVNGFGKSVGSIQINELGTLETPIALTNTLSVGAVATGLVRDAIRQSPSIGRATGTVNAAVFECNDGYLNDIQALAVTPDHVDAALADARPDFAQGSVGAGRGMSAFGLKGGIGSSSRHAGDHTVGALVLANYGRLPQLVLAGHAVGAQLAAHLAALEAPDQGSVIVVLATDVPLDHRQLRRVALRAAAGLARTGSNYGHGSGDIVVAFSTAQRYPHDARRELSIRLLPDGRLDPVFDAAAEATEQAVVNALFAATTVRGFAGHVRRALTDIVPDWRTLLA